MQGTMRSSGWNHGSRSRETKLAVNTGGATVARGARSRILAGFSAGYCRVAFDVIFDVEIKEIN